MCNYIATGVTLFLRDVSIPTDGSGHVLITDINPNGENNEDALICQSGKPISSDGDWYLHPTDNSTASDDRIKNPVYGVVDRGWNRNRATDSEGLRLVRLKRISAIAEEGVFTCDIPGDFGTPVSVGIYHPSES